MKWTATIDTLQQMTFVIEQHLLKDISSNHLSQAFYIYIYENGKGTHDYLQDTLQSAKDFVFDKYRVPQDVWQKIE